jgi:hypothetical protein
VEEENIISGHYKEAINFTDDALPQYGDSRRINWSFNPIRFNA